MASWNPAIKLGTNGSAIGCSVVVGSISPLSARPGIDAAPGHDVKAIRSINGNPFYTNTSVDSAECLNRELDEIYLFATSFLCRNTKDERSPRFLAVDCQVTVKTRGNQLPRGFFTDFEGISNGVSNELLNHPFYWPRPESLVDASTNEKFESGFGDGKFKSLLSKPGKLLRDDKLTNLTLRIRGKWLENNFLVKAPDEFRAEGPVKLRQDFPFERGEWQPCWSEKLLRANVAGADDVESRKVVCAMVGQGDARGVQHLQKEIPDQAVSLFDFIEEKNTLAMFGKNFPQPSWIPSFIPHEQFHGVFVLEFRHVEAEHGICPQKVTRKFQRQFRLPRPSRSEKKKRAETVCRRAAIRVGRALALNTREE